MHPLKVVSSFVTLSVISAIVLAIVFFILFAIQAYKDGNDMSLKAATRMLILGSLLLFAGTGIAFNVKTFAYRAAVVTGTVVEMKTNAVDHDKAAPIISYQTREGKEYVHQSNTYAKPALYSAGDKVQIYYDPDNPSDASLPSDSAIWYWMLILIGGGFVLGGMLFRKEARRLGH